MAERALLARALLWLALGLAIGMLVGGVARSCRDVAVDGYEAGELMLDF